MVRLSLVELLPGGRGLLVGAAERADEGASKAWNEAKNRSKPGRAPHALELAPLFWWFLPGPSLLLPFLESLLRWGLFSS